MTTKKAIAGLAVVGLFLGIPGMAHADLVSNGGFESTTITGSGRLNTNGYNATDWATTGYNFIFASGTADTTGAGSAHLKLWGPNGGTSNSAYSDNGMPVSSPDGGNFLAADGAYQVGAITQTISNLTAGHTYAVSFYYAGAQQSGFNGATTEAWKVSLGGGTPQETTVLNNVSHGFTGWQSQTFNYVANSSSEVLSFLAVGTPSGTPPFSLLDGVSMSDVSGSDVPEPTAFVGMFAGMIGLGVFARRRARIAKSAA
jgi:hypothetical protein